MSEMNDSNAAALVGNPEPMDRSEDNPMPSTQQQVILYTASGDYIYNNGAPQSWYCNK
jgi:hypothetical protein